MPAQVDTRRELIRLAQQGDARALEQLTSENLGLVRSLVNRFRGKGIEYDDLFQTGCMGLVKAAEHFNLEMDVQFSTYAVPVILGELRRAFRDNGAVKVSRGIKEKGLKLLQLRERMTQELGCDPSVSQLAEAAGMELEEVVMATDAMAPPISFSAEVGDGELTQEDFIGEDHTEELIDSMALRQALVLLPERERELVSLRYFRHLTQCDTARILKISQVQVSRLEKKTLQKLRHLLRE